MANDRSIELAHRILAIGCQRGALFMGVLLLPFDESDVTWLLQRAITEDTTRQNFYEVTVNGENTCAGICFASKLLYSD